MKRSAYQRWLAVVTAAIALAPAAGFAADRAAGRSIETVGAGVTAARLTTPIHVEGVNIGAGASRLDPALAGATGMQRVIVRLRSDAAALQNALPSATANAKLALQQEQGQFMARCEDLAPGARLLGQTQLVLNAVFIEVDANALPALASDPAVVRIAPIGQYTKHLGETVTYIGASAVQADGNTGEGVRVAVLDSGIDYYHANLGGSGDPAEYANDDPNIIEPGTFPTSKVVGGFDFVGSNWPNTAELFDPDPLDDGAAAGHGTHVADIIGGSGGVAPDVDLFAVKVCSSVSPACSGLALILGMEFAVDPDGDGDPSDRVDIINMSLGADYGQPFDDDLSLAVNNATALGVLTVASAGNAGDKPYISGSPAAAITALSVAQTQVPSASLQLIDADDLGLDIPAVFQPWSTALVGDVTGPLQYGDVDSTNLNGCAPFADDLTGKVVLVDRGACNFTAKIKNIGDAGGSAGIIGLVAPGAPFSGGDGGDRPIDIPGFMISQADSSTLQSLIGSPGIVTISADNQLPLVMQMVGSSSRGPGNVGGVIKPEIGAPGASVSANAGTGTGTGAFGGTSGAAPMVSGSAALVVAARPHLPPLGVKALLMTNAETNIDTDPFQGLAPITRIGGGEVRVDEALAARAVVIDPDSGQGALSFGFHDVSRDRVRLKGELLVHNLSDQRVTYRVTPVFRFADDAGSDAVQLHVKDRVRLKPGQTKKVKVRMEIDGAALPPNFMNSGGAGADPATLTLNEYDGYIEFDDGVNRLEVPWQVLPRQAASVKPKKKHFKAGGDAITLKNKGVGTAQNDAYTLLAVSGNLPRGAAGGQSPTPDLRAVGVNTIPVPAGFCGPTDSFIWLFAANTWERQTHLAPVQLIWWLDVNQDGAEDFAVLNSDLSGFGTLGDGRQAAFALDLATGNASAFFFVEHATNTGNTVLLVCGDQLGLDASAFGQNVNLRVEASDFYFGGPGDEIAGLTIAPLGERFVGSAADIPGFDEGELTINDFGALPGNTEELGLLLVTNGARGGANGGATQSTEALIIGLKGADLSALKDDPDDDDDDDDEDDDEEDEDDDD